MIHSPRRLASPRGEVGCAPEASSCAAPASIRPGLGGPRTSSPPGGDRSQPTLRRTIDAGAMQTKSGSARAEPLKQEHPPVARRRHVQPRIVGEDRLLQQVQLPCRLQAQ